MKKTKFMSVLVAMLFFLGIVSPVFAKPASDLGGGNWAADPNRFVFSDSVSKKPNQAYKASKTKLKRTKNAVKIEKGSVKKTVSIKSLSNKQKEKFKKNYKKYLKEINKSKTMKKLKNKYKKEPSPNNAKKIVNYIAKQLNKKVNALKKKTSSKKNQSSGSGIGGYRDFGFDTGDPNAGASKAGSSSGGVDSFGFK